MPAIKYRKERKPVLTPAQHRRDGGGVDVEASKQHEHDGDGRRQCQRQLLVGCNCRGQGVSRRGQLARQC